MIKRTNEMPKEIREKMRGGEGNTQFENWFAAGDFGGKVRLCSRITLPPGASIGDHAHEAEDEIYIVLAGTGKVLEAGEWVALAPGDAVLTGNGNSHSLKNDGVEPLVIAAVIIQY